MYTCCPHCKTCFRITEPQLAVAQGKVRCGTCSRIFNAREHLYETLPERKPASAQPPPATSRTAASAPPPTPPVAKASPRSDATPAPSIPESPAGADTGPDLDLFHSPAAPDPSEDELDDVFLEAGTEEENTAVIDVGDWDELDLEEPAVATPTPVAEEFHAPVREPILPPGEEDEDFDLFDDSEETEEEDTAVIDLSHAPDPFAPHAGVPLSSAAEEEEEDDLFDEEEEEDVTALIDMEDGRDLLAGIPNANRPPEETPLEDEATKAPLPGTEENEPLFEPDEHFRMEESAASREPPPAEPASGDSVQLPELEDFSFGPEAGEKKPDEETPAITTSSSDRYTYVDPEDLLKEEKGIDDIIAEMNAQLAEGLGSPADEEPEAAAKPAATPRPGGDDFESSFLANLDDVLGKPLPETPKPPKKPKPADTGKVPVKPAEVLDIINPADNLNQGMMSDETIPLPLREDLVSEKPGGNALKFSLQLLLVLILFAILGLQLAVFRSTEIANALPSLRPLLELVCQRVECRYNGPVDVDRIQLVSRDIRDHPTRPGALQIKATLVNKAPFAQPFPDMVITLSDLTGAVVARRRFPPREYLGGYWHPFLLMRPNQPVQITLDVLNPGQDAVNFEFEFKPSIQGRGTRG